MEFWGVEVKPGQTLKCDIDEGKLLHLSQAALGESKNKGVESVPIFVKFNDQKLVLGTLSLEKCAQIEYDLVFEKEFELSHGSKNASVHFCGYKTCVPDDYPSGEDYFDSDSEEDVPNAANANGKVKEKEQAKPAAGKTNADDNSAAKAKTKKEETVKAEKPKPKDEDDSEDESDDDDDDEDDSEDESDNDEDMLQPTGDSDDDDDEDDSGDEDEDEAMPKKAEVSGKKRPTESASKTPVPEKKAKVVSPAVQKTGGNGKKGTHTATPHPAKQAGKTPASGDKSKQQTPKSTGSATCKECNKSFNSDNALQSHNKAKHSAAK